MKQRAFLGGLTALMVVLLSAGLAFAGAQQPVDGTPDGVSARTVTTIGLGEVRVEPDMAVVELGVQVEAEAADEALDQVSEEVQAVMDALLEAGVAEEDIQTQVVQLNPRLELPPGPEAGRPEVTGFTATNIVRVQVRELEQLGELITTAVEAGANLVQSIGFQVSDPAEARDQALQRAFDDARTQAETLANLAEAELGDALAINSQNVMPVFFATSVAEFGGGGAVPIAPGQQSVTAQIQVTWLLSSGAEPAADDGEPGEPTLGLPPAAALEAQSELADRLNLSVDEVQIVSTEQVDWTDTCLGLGQANESCATVITPGWLIMLRAGRMEYEAHTDEQGDQVRFADL